MFAQARLCSSELSLSFRLFHISRSALYCILILSKVATKSSELGFFAEDLPDDLADVVPTVVMQEPPIDIPFYLGNRAHVDFVDLDGRIFEKHQSRGGGKAKQRIIDGKVRSTGIQEYQMIFGLIRHYGACVRRHVLWCIRLRFEVRNVQEGIGQR